MLAITQLECVRGERRLFANLNFEVAPQTLLEVRGANGSGKTSLLRNLCGLLPPAAGTIKWNGSDIHALGDEYRAHIAYLGHLSAVKDELTARENLLFSARAGGLPASAAGRRCRAAQDSAFTMALITCHAKHCRRDNAAASRWRGCACAPHARCGYSMSHSLRSTPPRCSYAGNCSSHTCARAAWWC